jgi:hypothetical protein
MFPRRDSSCAGKNGSLRVMHRAPYQCRTGRNFRPFCESSRPGTGARTGARTVRPAGWIAMRTWIMLPHGASKSRPPFRDYRPHFAPRRWSPAIFVTAGGPGLFCQGCSNLVVTKKEDDATCAGTMVNRVSRNDPSGAVAFFAQLLFWHIARTR